VVIMKTLDEIIGDKILELAHYMLSKVVKPDITIDKVSQLDEKEIEKIKQKYGIEGIILDVDDTLRKEMKNIPKCNQDWIESLRGKIKIIILSNGIDKKIEKYFQEKGIDYIGFAHKPLKKNFLKACKKMNVSPDKVLVVGDSLLDDIYGGKRIKMRTILVRDVEDCER
jgi:HAD superfamily phosphatase (TIGR01668 family)